MQLPYGSWPSSLTATDLAAASVQLDSPRLDGTDIYWLEGRPTEGGRSVLVRRSADGQTHDVTPTPWNVRSRVHEYGGGAYAVHDGLVVFTEFTTGQVIRLRDGVAEPLTTDAGHAVVRFGGLVLDPHRRVVYAVREDHRGPGEPVNQLVALDLDGTQPDDGTPLLEHDGPLADFVSAPVLSPDGRHLAWISWDHPNMPWDSTTLRVADLDAHGRVSGDRHRHPVAGGPGEAVEEPTWLAPGELLFLSDRTGFANPYTVAVPEQGPVGEPVPLAPADVEFGTPRWMLDLRTLARTGAGDLVVLTQRDGVSVPGVLDPTTGTVRTVPVETAYVTAVAGPTGPGVDPTGRTVVALARFGDRPAALVRLDVAAGTLEVLRSSADLTLDPGYVSPAEPVSWTSADGELAHGFYYPPAHPEVSGPDGELPPLIVTTHGGPTSAAVPGFAAARAYWTSRGIGVLDVNYGGSTGYGRAYRERLRGQWGLVDVADVCTGAEALADAGRVDRARMAISGGSAGGYTTLAALAFRHTFTAGASHFGVSDLSALARETHKFESQYLTGLVGRWPEAETTYRDRSPIHHTEGIDCPVILLQGEQDRVVPPNQAELMAQAVRAKGLPVALLLFPGEGHGFRARESLVRAREAEETFYGRVFGYAPHADLPDLVIENMEKE